MDPSNAVRSIETTADEQTDEEWDRSVVSRGRKNSPGNWLQGEILDRGASAAMIVMVFAGFGVGFAIRGLELFDGEVGIRWSAAFLVAVFLSFGIFYLILRRIDATWIRGLRAERLVGDLVEHALSRPGCAFAHDVKESLGGSGNVDHVVMTPSAVWVVETKSTWQGKRRFQPALRQVAESVRRVRRHLDSPFPVRGALVIADRWDRSLEAEHDWNGEPVMAFGPKTFWRRLRNEGEPDPTAASMPDRERVEKMVWDLGSVRHLDR